MIAAVNRSSTELVRSGTCTETGPALGRTPIVFGLLTFGWSFDPVSSSSLSRIHSDPLFLPKERLHLTLRNLHCVQAAPTSGTMQFSILHLHVTQGGPSVTSRAAGPLPLVYETINQNIYIYIYIYIYILSLTCSGPLDLSASAPPLVPGPVLGPSLAFTFRFGTLGFGACFFMRCRFSR